MVERHDLVGTWTLVSASATDDSGHRNETPFGDSAAGSLVYTDDGRISVIISHGGRQPLSTEDLSVATSTECAQAFRTFNAYSGRYVIDGDNITHRVEIASLPNWVGRELVRTAHCTSNQLILTTSPHPVDGSPRTFTLVWGRAR